MPHYISIGVAFDTVMRSTLRDLNVYDVAHEKKLKEQDYLNYLLGEYVFDAFSAVLTNMFPKKGAKGLMFSEIRDKPILYDIEARQEAIDQEKAYEQYRVQRQIDKLNWDLARIYEGKGE